MKPDEGGVCDDIVSIANIGQLSLWSFGKSLGISAVGKSGHFQKHFGLRDEGTWVWQPEGRPKGVKSDHQT
jgi:hypothetical protein